jgi:hypothetical protein
LNLTPYEKKRLVYLIGLISLKKLISLLYWVNQSVNPLLACLQVEVWLNRLLERQCSTVRHEMTEAVAGYEEKPRDQWLFDYPAQVALCGTQIWWTTEVNIAFGRLEEGYENALKDYNKKQVCADLYYCLGRVQN